MEHLEHTLLHEIITKPLFHEISDAKNKCRKHNTRWKLSDTGKLSTQNEIYHLWVYY